MLTSAQREKCRRIAAALDRGDQGPWLRAEASLGPVEKAEIWSMRRHVKAMAEQQHAKAPSIARRLEVAAMRSTRMDDLDFWSDDAPGVDDDDDIDDDAPPEPEDDPMSQTTKICMNCRGLGRSKDGSVCDVCDGTGRVPMDDFDEGKTYVDDDE
jgi:hypothetical protein